MCLWIYIVLPVVTLGFNMTCPDTLQRVIRSEYVCKNSSKEHYSCLFDELNQTYVESCKDPDFVRFGEKYIVSGQRRNTHCSFERYQPFKFWSNMSSQCLFTKSTCNEIGQILVDNVSTRKDTLCRCDYTKGFSFIKKPRNNCSCIPSEDDCTCFAVQCPLNYILTADYQCKPETVIAHITFCSKIQISREENEKTDLPVSKIMWQTTSKLWDRNEIQFATCFIVWSLAFAAYLTIKGYFTKQERGNADRAIPDNLWGTQPQNIDNETANTQERYMYMQQLRNEMENFEKILKEWVSKSETAIETLNSLADELDVHFSRISKTKIGGSAAGIVGSVLGVVGLALTPVTFGASLGLSIAGGVVAGLGGATVGGSFIADNVLSKKTKINAEAELTSYSSGIQYIKETCLELSDKLKQIGTLEDKLEEKFPEWVHFWELFAHGQESDISKLDWKQTEELIRKSIKHVESAARFIGGGVEAGIQIAGAALRVTGTSLHVASGIIGALMIPFDIYTLVDSAIDVHKKNKHKTSELILEVSKAIKSEIPKIENIEEMIKCTIDSIHA